MSVSPNDYISIAYYGFYRTYPPGSDPSFAFNEFKLIAVDKIKYHFQNEPPVHQAPTAPSDIELSFNGNTSELMISTSSSTDPDTLDNLISYQYNYTTSSEVIFNNNNWRLMDSTRTAVFEPVYDNNYIIGVRAIDEFNNPSKIVSSTWSFPSSFVIIQQQNRDEQGFLNGNAGAVAQVFRVAHSGFVKGIKFITQGFYNGSNGAIQAFLYNTDDPNNAANDNLLASSTQKIVWGTYSSATHILTFQNPPFLEEGSIYTWIINFSGVSSNLKGTNSVDSVGGSGWARFSKWYSADSRPDLAAKNYYFVLIGSTIP